MGGREVAGHRDWQDVAVERAINVIQNRPTALGSHSHLHTGLPNDHFNRLKVFCQSQWHLAIIVVNLILLDIGVIRSPAH
jgi:hypothetical protein